MWRCGAISQLRAKINKCTNGPSYTLLPSLVTLTPQPCPRIGSVHPVDISTGAQKAPSFLRLNPNGRIPVLVDANRSSGSPGHAVFESGAILLYLAQHYDTLRTFAADPQADAETYSEVLQWLFFTVRPASPCVPPDPLCGDRCWGWGSRR